MNVDKTSFLIPIPPGKQSIKKEEEIPELRFICHLLQSQTLCGKSYLDKKVKPEPENQYMQFRLFKSPK